MNTYGYRDANGIEHESYEAACHYYGADTPAQLAAEAAYYDQLAWIDDQDAMEARGGPRPFFKLEYDDPETIPF